MLLTHTHNLPHTLCDVLYCSRTGTVELIWCEQKENYKKAQTAHPHVQAHTHKNEHALRVRVRERVNTLELNDVQYQTVPCYAVK